MNIAALGGDGKTAGRRRSVIALGLMAVAVCVVLDAAGAAAADATSESISASDFSRMTLEELTNIDQREGSPGTYLNDGRGLKT